ncbi:MAG TPA: sulfotransferase [Rudaea sp.]|nr:sulfotransferase [Rudaea sp.]
MQSTATPTIEPIVTALQSGHPRDAERLARDYLAVLPANEDGLILLSMCLLQQDRPAEATTVCRELTQLFPQSAIYWSNLGTALRDAGELRDAEDAYRQAVLLDPGFFGAFLNLGYLLLEGGKFPEAKDALFAAHTLDPVSPDARIYAAQTCVALDSRDLAEQLIAPWQQWTHLADELTLDLASLMISAGSADEGARIFEGLLRKNPNNLRATANLVYLYERINRLDEARALLAKLPTPESIDDPKLQYDVISAHATFTLREKDPALARQLFEKLIAAFDLSSESKNTPWRSGQLYSSLAKMYDKENNVDAAMNALAESHARQMTLARQAVPELAKPDAQPLSLGTVRLDPRQHAKWQDYPAPSMRDSPIFVVGFPRSGTTMLEQMLDAHPSLQSMDERSYLSNLVDYLSNFGVEYPKDLDKLSADQCDELRRVYWNFTAKVAPRKEGQRLVDKNPLHMLRLPLINRLFPNAPIILALRHPCDVILSNYMQYFTSNSFAVLCSSLERLAHGYVNAMQSWIYHADLLKPNVIHSRYEDLLDDFAGNILRIGNFLELNDAAPMARFDQHARDKGFISTPSYTQVVEPPNKKAVDRWRRYHKYFEPVLPILQPIMHHWGYHE